MKKLIQNEFVRFFSGAFIGILISTTIINWSPVKREINSPLVSNEYSLTDLTNGYSIFIAPLSWPAPLVEHEVIFGCSSDSEVTGCYGNLNEINNGRLYLTIILALYLGLIFLYLPNTWDKGVTDMAQATFFIITILGVFMPFHWLFPDIIEYNSSNWLTPALILLLIYIPSGLFGIYQIILEKFRKKTKIAKIIGLSSLIVIYLLSVYLWILLAIANSF